MNYLPILIVMAGMASVRYKEYADEVFYFITLPACLILLIITVYTEKGKLK